MRSLIRPALFMIARLGLLLSVVAWVAGQWWQISLEVPFGSFGSGSLHLVCGSRGHAVIVFDPFSVRPVFELSFKRKSSFRSLTCQNQIFTGLNYLAKSEQIRQEL